MWNGLTTKAYGEFLYSIIINEIKIPNKLHIIPKNSISKFELLKYFKKKFKIKLKINKHISKKTINRTLSTNNKILVNKIWRLSKFKANPTIREMIDII